MEIDTLASMTCTDRLALWSSVLAFIGGALLIVDTFSPVRQLLLKGGKQKWEWLSSRLGLGTKLPTPPPPPTNDTGALDRAKRSQGITRAGFGLITLGFLLDLMAKLHCAFVLGLMARLHLC
jgi:hypothetical protein